MEWKTVICSLRGGYREGFDHDKFYSFRRVGQEGTQVFRLAGQSPYFNVAGLQFAELPDCLRH